MPTKKKFAFQHKPSKQFLMEDEGGMYMSTEPYMTFEKKDTNYYLDYIKECFMWDGDNKICTEDELDKLDLDDIEIVEVKLQW